MKSHKTKTPIMNKEKRKKKKKMSVKTSRHLLVLQLVEDARTNTCYVGLFCHKTTHPITKISWLKTDLIMVNNTR